MNFKVCSFSQTPWCLNLINISRHVDLLTDEAMFMGWNPTGK